MWSLESWKKASNQMTKPSRASMSWASARVKGRLAKVRSSLVIVWRGRGRKG